MIISHPIQYYAPWFKHLNERDEIELKVFYLWNAGVTPLKDPSFGTTFSWDIPLLEGYSSEFIRNTSKNPGTHNFWGLDNPDLILRVENFKPDAILMYGYTYKSAIKIILSRRLKKIPILYRGDSHDINRKKSLKNFISKTIRKIIFRRFSAVLAVGKSNSDYFLSSGVNFKKIVHVPHCVDNNRFQVDSGKNKLTHKEWLHEIGIPEESFVFLFVGKFEIKKRPIDLIDAFIENLNENWSHYKSPKLLFVGAGILEGDLRKRAESLLGKEVFIAPFQNQSQMPKVYKASDVLVLPSFGSSETWGLVVNEMMAVGKPAIVSSHVGCGADLIEEGNTGWVFKAGEKNDLKRCMLEAFTNTNLLKRMENNVHEKISKYSYSVATDNLINYLYNSKELKNYYINV